MTYTTIARTETVLVAIDIAKACHGVLIAVPGKKRCRRLTMLNQFDAFNRLMTILSDHDRLVRVGFHTTGNFQSCCVKA